MTPKLKIWAAPRSEDELREALSRRPEAIILGGGTVVVPLLEEGGDRPVVALQRLSWATLGEGWLGASCTLAQLAASGLHAAICSVASRIGTPAVRNQATVGGNVAWGRVGSLATPLLALKAVVRGMDRTGEDVEIGLADFLMTRPSVVIRGFELGVDCAARSLVWPMSGGRGGDRLTATLTCSRSAAGATLFYHLPGERPQVWQMDWAQMSALRGLTQSVFVEVKSDLLNELDTSRAVTTTNPMHRRLLAGAAWSLLRELDGKTWPR